MPAEYWLEFASFTYDGIGYGEASEEEVAQDVKQWKETLEPVLGPVSILFYANGSDLASYEGAKFQTLYEGGFRYFCALDSSVPSWVQIENTYVRQAAAPSTVPASPRKLGRWPISLTLPKSSPRTGRNKLPA